MQSEKKVKIVKNQNYKAHRAIEYMYHWLVLDLKLNVQHMCPLRSKRWNINPSKVSQTQNEMILNSAIKKFYFW